MPHIFKVQCYRNHIQQGKAKVGDVVYLKARPDVAMSVSVKPYWNSAANKINPVQVRWMRPDLSIETGEFFAEELSL